MENHAATKENIVIIGGGIQGACIAFYLMKQGVTSTIVEEVSIAAAASGKAGGFLAKNWGDAITTPLHNLSYDLHAVLARELNIESYRQIPTMQLTYQKNSKRKLDTEIAASWIDKSGVAEMMDSLYTAQVDPLELTTKLVDAAVNFGSKVIYGRVKHICKDKGCAVGVKYQPRDRNEELFLPASKVVIATGPWAGVHSQDWLGVNIPMKGIKSTSMVYKNCPHIILEEPFAFFCDDDDNGCHLEIFPRNNAEIYICGCGGSDVVEGDSLREGGDSMHAGLIQPNIPRSHAAARSFSSLSSLGDRWPDTTQACLRPITADGMPVMGALLGVGCDGVYISAGHNCWGILWAPASGLCMSEMLLTGSSKSLDLSDFSPSRFF